MRAILKPQPGFEHYRTDYGPYGAIAFEPQGGDAALADANGRFGILIHGARGFSNSELYATSGSLRLFSGDMLRLIRFVEASEAPVHLEISESRYTGLRVREADVPEVVEDPPRLFTYLCDPKATIFSEESITRRAALAKTALLTLGPSVVPFSNSGPIVPDGIMTATAYASSSRVVDSVSGFFSRSHAETKGFGRYTYVLLAAASHRNGIFVKDLLNTTPVEQSSETRKLNLNVFEMPVFDKLYKMAGPAATYLETLPSRNMNTFIAQIIENYDYGLSRDLLDTLCLSPKTPTICKTAREQGPYLLTFARPISRLRAVPAPYLSVDLSKVDPAAFPYFLNSMKEQVQVEDITDESRIFSTRSRLLAVIAALSSWLPSIQSSVAHIVQMIK